MSKKIRVNGLLYEAEEVNDTYAELEDATKSSKYRIDIDEIDEDSYELRLWMYGIKFNVIVGYILLLDRSRYSTYVKVIDDIGRDKFTKKSRYKNGDLTDFYAIIDSMDDTAEILSKPVKNFSKISNMNYSPLDLLDPINGEKIMFTIEQLKDSINRVII